MSDERLYARVPSELHERLKVGAAKSGLTFNKYLNNLLEERHSGEDFRTMVIELLHEILDEREREVKQIASSVNIEILIFLRTLSTPDQHKRVNAELRRNGYSPVELSNE